MTREQGYQGWPNYQTWAVNLWLNNDADTYESCLETAKWALARAQASEGNEFAKDERQRARLMLADAYKQENEDALESWMPDQSSLFADLMNSAVEQIDWYAIADTFIESVLEAEAA